MQIGIIGAGWVGVTTAAALAHLGHDVLCADIHPERVTKLQSGALSFFEPGLEELLREGLGNGRVHFTSSNEETIRANEIIFVCVDTPAKPDGSADLSQVMAVARDFAQFHREKSIFVIKSTVPAGTCQKIASLIHEEAGLRGNTATFGVATNPEFLAESTAVRDALQPARIIIGADDEEVGQRVQGVFEPLIKEGRPVMVTDTASAEIIKGASNAYLANRISFVNEVANYASAVGADPYEVARGMSFDPRIGKVRPGVGFGGGCFPKDVRSLLHEGQLVGQPLTILARAAEVNQRQRERYYELLVKALGTAAGKRVAILGLTFKPNTDDVREAPALYFIERLLNEGAQVAVYDPRGMEKIRRQFSNLLFAESALAAAHVAEAVVVLTEWEEFTKIDLEELKKTMRGNILVDGRGVWKKEAAEQLGFVFLR